MALAAWRSSSWSVLVSTDSRAVTKPASPKPLRTTADRKQKNSLNECQATSIENIKYKEDIQQALRAANRESQT